jgi:arylformamidase
MRSTQEWSVLDLRTLCNLFRQARHVDLSQPLKEYMPTISVHGKYYHELWNSPTFGDRSLSYQLNIHEHYATHMDAPAHFLTNGKSEAAITVDQIPANRLIGRGVRLDCRELNAGEVVSRNFIESWEADHGTLEPADIVLFNFGWPKYWAPLPEGKAYCQNWPGVGRDAAEYLIDRQLSALGVDTLSPDTPEQLRKESIHPLLLERQILIIENLCHLEELPDFFFFCALPLPIYKGSGSPLRAVALIL